MFREVNITNRRTVYLNRDAIAIVERGADELARIRLLDGTEYQTNEVYEEFLELFDLVRTGTKPGQK